MNDYASKRPLKRTHGVSQTIMPQITVYTQLFHKNEYALNTTTDGNIGVLSKIVTLKTHNDQLKNATRNHKIHVVLSNPIRPTENGLQRRNDGDCTFCQVRQ